MSWFPEAKEIATGTAREMALALNDADFTPGDLSATFTGFCARKQVVSRNAFSRCGTDARGEKLSADRLY